MPPESVAFWSGVVGVVLTIIGAALGGVSLHYSRKAGQLKDAEVRQLQERDKPRSVTTEGRAAMLSLLAQHLPEGDIDIQFLSSTTESGQLAFALADILKEANWPATKPSGGPIAGRPSVGVIVLVSDQVETPSRATWLHSALNAGGLEARLVRTPNPSFKPGTVTLRVGLKQ